MSTPLDRVVKMERFIAHPRKQGSNLILVIIPWIQSFQEHFSMDVEGFEILM